VRIRFGCGLDSRIYGIYGQSQHLCVWLFIIIIIIIIFIIIIIIIIIIIFKIPKWNRCCYLNLYTQHKHAAFSHSSVHLQYMR
jgi:hypothetical protein